MTEQDLKNEIKKLKNKIDDLDDKIDEKEDEIKKLKRELEKSQNAQESSEKAKKLEEEKEYLQSEKNNLENELEKKNKSLMFINAILSDKKTNDYDKLYNELTEAKNYLEDTLLEEIKLSSNFNELYNESLSEDFNKWEIIERKQWLKGKSTIAFIGEFSSGKTSLINAILKDGVANSIQLPTSMKATTAIPTYICGSTIAHTNYYFLDKENATKALPENIFKIIDHETLKDLGNIPSLLQYFIMECQNPNLNNLTILDTPGFSNDNKDNERTLDVINESDALFWVFDVNTGDINQSSLNVIQKHLKKPLYIVINKVDTKPEKGIDEVEKQITKTLNNKNIKFESIIRFSNKENKYLDNIKNIIKTIRPTNQYKSMYDVIKEYQSEFRNHYNDIRSNLANNNREYKKKINNFETDLNEARKTINENKNFLNEETDSLSECIENIREAIKTLDKVKSDTWFGLGDDIKIDRDFFNNIVNDCKDLSKDLIESIPTLQENIKIVIEQVEDYTNSHNNLADAKARLSSDEDDLKYLDNEKSNIEKLFDKLLEKLSKIKSFNPSDNSYQNKNNSSSTKNSNWFTSMIRNKFQNTSESSNKSYVIKNDKTNSSAKDYIKWIKNK